MNKEELIGKLHMIYAGDRNALEEMVGYYDGLKQVIEIVQQENKKYKKVIDKAIEYIENCLKQTPIENRTKNDDILDIEYEYILGILKEVK